MRKLTGKGKHTVKVGNHPHTNISKRATMRRVQMQEIGIAFEIKRSATENNLVHIYCYIKTSWELQTKKLQ